MTNALNCENDTLPIYKSSIVLFFLIVTCVFVCNFCSASPNELDNFTITIGQSKFYLPAIPGFKEVSNTVPEIADNFSAYILPINRLAAVLISQDDLISYLNGSLQGFNRFIIVQVTREFESINISEADWSIFREKFKSNIQEMFSSKEFKNPETLKGQFPSQLVESVTFGQQIPLEWISKEANDLLSYLSVFSYYDQNNKKSIMGLTLSVVYLKGKVFHISFFSDAKDGSDLDWLRNTTESWQASFRKSKN